MIAAKEQFVHDLVRAVAARNPDALAVEAGLNRITYGDLEARSQRLARVFHALGVVRGTVVGLFVNDTIDVITGILAALKAGGIFCPLDPGFPEKRLRIMAEAASLQLFFSHSRHFEKLAQVRSGLGGRIILADDGAVENGSHEIVRLSDKTWNHAASFENDSVPDEGCSIYFTSGTTGKPKAIVGRLKGIDHFARWEAGLVGVGEGTRVSQLASCGFDGYLKDVFVPLCAGGVVCAPESREVVKDAGQLIDWIDVEGVEVVHCVPSVLRAMLNEKLEERYFAGLRWVVLAGEALLPADVKRWKAVFGERIGLVNLYGPTETTVTKLYYIVQPGDEERPTIPIGKPMPGAEVLLVNSRGQQCRPGTVGEIYIRTPYRALGYYGEPEMTGEVFVKNPFREEEEGDIVYRTGDYGRQLKDGNLEFLGRRDQQVKVRGVRVELVEIESVLRSHEGVKDVAVVDVEDGEGGRTLCAYVVVKEGTEVEQLREYAGERLPGAMVPTVMVEMKELPRTLNGKVERKMLPRMEQVREEGGGGGRRGGRGRGQTEEIIAEIWSGVLKVKEIGREENFFQLGGHSLLATQVMTRVNKALGSELGLRDLFEAPTVKGLGERVEEEKGRRRGGRGKEEREIERVERGGELELSYGQQRMWVLEQLAGGSGAFNFPMGLGLRGRVKVLGLEQTIGEIVRRHEVLRTRYPGGEGKPRQEIEEWKRYGLRMVDVSGLEGEEREKEGERLAEEEGGRGFDLERGPLVRVVLVRKEEERHGVLCTMHHMVGDAWSMEVLTGELGRIYEEYGRGEPSRLEELRVQYADYAQWQREMLRGEELERRVGYWRKQMEGARRELALPQRRRSPAAPSFRGARCGVEIGGELAEGLREVGRREGATLYMTMLSGFVVLLNQYTGEEDVVVGTVIANREREEVEKLIGFVANTLLLRVEVGGGPSLREVVGRVREVCLEGYGHQMPPEKLVEELGGEWGVGGGERLYPVWFQMERARREQLELAGLELERYEGKRGNTRFELSLVLEETPQGIVGDMEFDQNLFDEDTIRQMVSHYRSILEEMVRDPSRAVAGVVMESHQVSDEMICGFNSSLE